jgi:hypothetical protein
MRRMTTARREPPVRRVGVRTICTLDRLETMVEDSSRFDEFSIDVETVGGREARGKKDRPALDWRTNIVWCIAMSAGITHSEVIPVGHPDRSRRQVDIETSAYTWLPSCSPAAASSVTTSASTS